MVVLNKEYKFNNFYTLDKGHTHIMIFTEDLGISFACSYRRVDATLKTYTRTSWSVEVIKEWITKNKLAPVSKWLTRKVHYETL